MTSFLINQKQEVYNMIIGIASFQHIPTPKERLLCIKHCYKTLTYNGTLLLSNRSRSLRFCKKHRKNILHSWIQRMQKKLFTRNDIIIPRTDQGKTLNRYYHFFTISELRTLFLKSGFTNIKTQYTGIQGITNDRKKSKNTLVIGKKSVYY